MIKSIIDSFWNILKQYNKKWQMKRPINAITLSRIFLVFIVILNQTIISTPFP